MSHDLFTLRGEEVEVEVEDGVYGQKDFGIDPVVMDAFGGVVSGLILVPRDPREDYGSDGSERDEASPDLYGQVVTAVASRGATANDVPRCLGIDVVDEWCGGFEESVEDTR